MKVSANNTSSENNYSRGKIKKTLLRNRNLGKQIQEICYFDFMTASYI